LLSESRVLPDRFRVEPTEGVTAQALRRLNRHRHKSGHVEKVCAPFCTVVKGLSVRRKTGAGKRRRFLALASVQLHNAPSAAARLDRVFQNLVISSPQGRSRDRSTSAFGSFGEAP
jgi:hypothetical protein